jgi:hypothetical protein
MKIAKNLSHDIQYPREDTNWSPTQYISQALPVGRTCSVNYRAALFTETAAVATNFHVSSVIKLFHPLAFAS